MAAVIVTQIPRYQPKPPRSVPGPASMPRIRSTVTAHATAAPATSRIAVRRRATTPTPRSVRVFILAEADRLLWLRLWRPIEQEAEERRHERVRRRHGVGVVDGAVLLRERDVARRLAQAVLELGPHLLRPELEPFRRL